MMYMVLGGAFLEISRNLRSSVAGGRRPSFSFLSLASTQGRRLPSCPGHGITLHFNNHHLSYWPIESMAQGDSSYLRLHLSSFDLCILLRNPVMGHNTMTDPLRIKHKHGRASQSVD